MKNKGKTKKKKQGKGKYVKCFIADVRADVESVTKSPCVSFSDEKNLAVAGGSAYTASGSIRVTERLALRQPQGPQSRVVPAKLSQQSETAALASRVSAITGEYCSINTLSRPCQPCRQ